MGKRKLMWSAINLVVILYALIPLLWILSLSFKSNPTDGRLIPADPTLANYRDAFAYRGFTSALVNSIGVGLITTVIAVVIGTMAAYAIARLDFRGKKLLVGATLLIAMFPQISLVTPLFNIERRLGLFDTWPGLILPYITFALPLAVYTLSAFFREIPWDLEKAAKLDGATGAQAFRRVIVPLAAPGVVTAAILVFIFSWNELLLALSLTSSDRAITAPVAITNFSGVSEFTEPTGQIAAAAVVITIPIIVFVLIFQRRIVADGITKRYPDGSVAVACLDLAIADGEFVILVGPSGCGKSTTLNMFAGLEDISDGELRIDGVRVNETAPRDRDIAMVFQNYALYPHMTVRQNIEFPLTLARPRPGKDEIAAKVAEVSSILGLDDYLDRKPAQLSGGQRQRVAMGRAIVRSPKAFLMDEPLSNLDAKLRGAMRVEIARLQARLGTTTVYVTHDQTEAMTLGDRVVVMRDGQVQQIGTPDDLYNNPVNLFVAGFIGSPAMNMLTGRLTAQGVQTDFGLLALPDVSYVEQAAALVHGDGEVVVGIRPEHLHDAALAAVAGVPPGTQEIVAIVDVLESLGSDNYAHLQIPGGEIVARLSPQSQIRRGNRATLSFEPGSIAVFDAKSGINLSR